MATKHIIWSNRNLNLDDWREDLVEEYGPMSDSELYDKVIEVNNDYLDDERVNLGGIVFPEGLICIARLGLWDGVHDGYRDIDSGKIIDCFNITVGEFVEWYVDGYGNLRCTDSHHDGTNTYVVRRWKPGLSEDAKDRFRCYIVNGKAPASIYSRYTVAVGQPIADVYGWKLGHAQRKKG